MTQQDEHFSQVPLRSDCRKGQPRSPGRIVVLLNSIFAVVFGLNPHNTVPLIEERE